MSESAAGTRGIVIAHGDIFSAAGKYRNCMRLSHACTLDARTERALCEIGEAIHALLEQTSTERLRA